MSRCIRPAFLVIGYIRFPASMRRSLYFAVCQRNNAVYWKNNIGVVCRCATTLCIVYSI